MRATLLSLVIAICICSGCAPTQTTKVARPQLYSVDAKLHEGTFIGRYKEADTIIMQYVSGTWTIKKGRWPMQSPDIAKVGELSDLYFCTLYERTSDGYSELTPIPWGTKTRPFSYTFRQSCDAYLRIHDTLSGGEIDNDGSVIYSIIKQ